MNGFALGKAFQAVGNDLGVSSQIQFDQSMQQQMGAQRAAATQAHDQFMQKMNAQHETFTNNQNQQKMAQQSNEFGQRMAATTSHNQAMEAQGAQRTSAYVAATRANIARSHAEVKKVMSSVSGSGGSKPPTQSDLLALNARLLGQMNGLHVKMATGAIPAGDKNTARTLQQLQAEQQKIQTLLAGHAAQTSAAPAQAQPLSATNPTTGQRVYLVNGQWTSAAPGAPAGNGQ